MIARRILYPGQFVAAAALPLLLLITRGILDDSAAWEFLVYLVIAVLLGAVMYAVAGLTAARRSARQSRSVSVVDAVVFPLWYLALIAFSFWPLPGFAVAALLLTVGSVWLAAWQLFTETRRRFRTLVSDFEHAARPPMAPGEKPRNPRVIVINPSEDDSSR